MNKKGFTLIELLAVIVILAIIALIALPIVLNMINDLRKDSTEISMKNIEKAASLYFQQNRKDENIVFECSNNKCKYNNKELELNGKSPESGKILIDKKGNITYVDIVLNGFNCYKEHNKFVCDTKKIRKIYNDSEIIINSDKEYNLFDYNIYGNSVQNETTLQYESVGDKTKNLFDKNDYVKEINGVIGFSTKNLIMGIKYTISSNKPLTWIKISNSNAGYSSKGYKNVDGFYEYTFEMSRNSNIPETETQYIYLGNEIGKSSFAKEISSFDEYEIQIEEGDIVTEYEQYGRYKIPIRVLSGKNLLDNTNLLAQDTKDRDFEVTETGIKQTKLSSDGYSPVTLYDITDLVKPNETYYIHREIEKNFTGSNSTNDSNAGSLKLVIDGTEVKVMYTNNEIISYKMPEEFKKVEIKTHTVPTDNNIQDFDENKTYYFEWENLYMSIEPYTEYEPGYNKIVNIYLDEPLRKVGEKADYIDFKNRKVVRYIEEDNEGNLTVLSIQKEEKIELPEILLRKGPNDIKIQSSIKPSNVELEYYK